MVHNLLLYGLRQKVKLIWVILFYLGKSLVIILLLLVLKEIVWGLQLLVEIKQAIRSAILTGKFFAVTGGDGRGVIVEKLLDGIAEHARLPQTAEHVLELSEAADAHGLVDRPAQSAPDETRGGGGQAHDRLIGPRRLGHRDAADDDVAQRRFQLRIAS